MKGAGSLGSLNPFKVLLLAHLSTIDLVGAAIAAASQCGRASVLKPVWDRFRRRTVPTFREGDIAKGSTVSGRMS